MHKSLPAVVEVSSEKSSIMFSFIIHYSDDIDSRKIDDSFYINYSLTKKVPEDLHHEIEICFPDISSQKNVEKIHFYKSIKDEGTPYVCWTAHVKYIRQAVSILKMWSAGTAYTINHGEGFERFFTEDELAQCSFENGLKILKEEYGIIAKVICPVLD